MIHDSCCMICCKVMLVSTMIYYIYYTMELLDCRQARKQG